MNKKILVIGDIILDKYIIGEVERFAPTAYVPVLKESYEKIYLGGASNVFKILNNLNINSDLCGVVGDDVEGEILRSNIKKYSTNIDYIYIKNDFKSIVKNYYYSENNQFLFRYDREEQVILSDIEYDKLFLRIKENIQKYNLILISDYYKGFINERFVNNIITLCNENNIKVFVDSKNPKISIFKGSNLIKISIRELEGIFNRKFVEINETIKFAKLLRKIIKSQNVIITNGDQQIVHIDEDDHYYLYNIDKNNVVDSNGAGDVFFAFIGKCLLENKKLDFAIECAKKGSMLACNTLGTYDESVMKYYKIINFSIESEKLNQIVQLYKGKDIVFVNGCFEILHCGHINLFKKAKAKGDILIVGINSDDYIEKYKKKRKPYFNEEQRIEMLSSIKYIDHIVLFDDENPINLVKLIKPKIVVKGQDYKNKLIIEKKEIKKNGGKIIILDNEYDISSSKIINVFKNDI